MSLSPEERRKIYQEEKARIEDEERRAWQASGPATTGLKPNVAGLLCYLGGWVTGIIFLVLEQRDRFVRFHALQSIVTFGALTVAGALLGWIPVLGGFFGAIVGITAFILWVVLMIKTYQGEMFKLPIAGEVAGAIMESNWFKQQAERQEGAGPAESLRSSAVRQSKRAEELSRRMERYFKGSHAGRVVGYSVAIFWNVVALVFFTAFYQYIAWYHTGANGTVTRLPLLTNDYFLWLPILVAAIIMNIAGNVILIIFDRYWLRSLVQMVLNLISIIVIINLLRIFPFNLSVIPNAGLSNSIQVGLPILLIVLAVLVGVAVLVEFVRLMIYISGHNQSQQD